jgi:parafibromin
MDVAKYLQNAKANGIPSVSILVKDDIYNYMIGKSDTCKQLIQPTDESTAKRRKLSAWTLEDVLDNELSVSSRSTALQQQQLAINVPALLKETEALDIKTIAKLKPQAVAAKAGEGASPIILVPAGQSALVSLRNCGDLFAHNRLVDANAPDREFTVRPDPKAPHMVRVSRPSQAAPGKQATFCFCDAPAKLTKDQWPRVVAAIVTGQAWQLDALAPVGKSPTEIFGKLQGYYFHFEGDAVAPAVMQWSVKRVPFSRNKRHDDAVVVASFWKSIVDTVKAKSSKVPLQY